jgi:hypothetical protein
MRLAIAQGWLLNRGVEDDREELAAGLAGAPSSSPLWPDFERETLDAFADKWSFFDFQGSWGVWSDPAPYAEGLELVFLMMTEGAPPGPITVEADEPWAALPLLMRWTDARWLVAGVSQAGPPTPGWPPTWPTGPKNAFDL